MCISPLERCKGIWQLQCKFCENFFKASSVSRVWDHFLSDKREIERCDKVSKKIRKAMSFVLGSTRGRKRKFPNVDGSESERPNLGSIDVGARAAQQVEAIDKAVAECFFSCGIPFHTTCSPFS